MMEQHSECFKGKRILDIGCNSGFITINVAKMFQPKSIVGIDIDPELISTARRQVEKQKTDPNSNDTLNNVIFRTVSFNPRINFNFEIIILLKFQD
jgi:ribosomal protein L11 methylase PrmA